MITEESSKSSRTVSKSALIVFFVQVSVIFISMMAAITNLSLGNGNKLFWTALLMSCIGYVLPNPRIKVINEILNENKTPSLKSLNNQR